MALINSAMRVAKTGAGLAIPATMFIGGIGTYQEDRKEGHSVPYSVIHGAASAWAQNTFFWPMLALQVAPLTQQMGRMMQEKRGELQRNQMQMSPYRFKDSEYAQTTRQRALEAIQNSRGRVSGYLGKEAGLFATRYR